MRPLPRRVRLVILDLDGVVYRGTRAIPGAAELVAALHARGTLVRFGTNNSTVTRAGYAERLQEMGIPAAADEIVTSTTATIVHLRHAAPDVQRILAVGAPGMLAELAEAGYAATAASEAAPRDFTGGPLPDRYDAVVVGLDPEVDYRRLGAAMSAIRSGARFIATNADRRYPTAKGFMPGAGAIVASVATATEVIPEVIGKPQPAMFRAILAAAAVPAGEAVVIGDNPEVDMVAAARAGIASILVLSGVADRAAGEAALGEHRPSVIADGPAEVVGLLDERLDG
jgi:4-nitrophenyl phosphatase